MNRETGFEHTDLKLLAFSGFVCVGFHISRRKNKKICIIVLSCTGELESVLLTYSHDCHSCPVWEIKGSLGRDKPTLDREVAVAVSTVWILTLFMGGTETTVMYLRGVC